MAVVGALQNSSYDDKEGNKRYVTEIIAEEIELLMPREDVSQKLQ